MFRRTLPALAAWLLPSLLPAQASGRWAVNIRLPDRSIRAELVLEDSVGHAAGSLVLEPNDSEPVRLEGVSLDPGGLIRFRATLDVPWAFVGRFSNDSMTGRVRVGASGEWDWSAWRLAHGDEYYADIPTFTLRQVMFGRDGPVVRVPGPWLAAAEAEGETTGSVLEGYRALCTRTGVAALGNQELGLWSLQRPMGVYRRAELLEVIRRTLGEIRDAIPSDTARVRFDALFRPSGQWRVDIHDAALAFARQLQPGLAWDSAAAALAAANLLPADVSEQSETIPLALFRLYVRTQGDSAVAATILREARIAQPRSALAVDLLLRGYAEAAVWYAEAMRFFLQEPWLGDAGRGRSLADLVRAQWRDSTLPIPEVRIHLFGYPEGAPHVGVPASLLAALIRPENGAARAWLARHEGSSLLTLLRGLPRGTGDPATIDFPSGRWRLTTVGQEAGTAFDGFLEPTDQVVLDPSYLPLLALGTLVHEWQHLLQEHARVGLKGAGSAFVVSPEGVTLLPTDRFLAEGFAEWSAEQILAPLVRRWPAIGLGESEKRAAMAVERPDDPHLLGYRMLRALARMIPRPERVAALVVTNGANPAAILAAPEVRRWRRYTRIPDHSISFQGTRGLIPETRFTIEDMHPEVVSIRISVPPAPLAAPPHPR